MPKVETLNQNADGGTWLDNFLVDNNMVGTLGNTAPAPVNDSRGDAKLEAKGKWPSWLDKFQQRIVEAQCCHHAEGNISVENTFPTDCSDAVKPALLANVFDFLEASCLARGSFMQEGSNVLWTLSLIHI